MLEFDLSKKYGDFSLHVAARVGPEWLVMLAPSGAGKSLTLDLIAGLTAPDRGYVRLDGKTLYDGAAGIRTPIRHRRIGYSFQSYALFPHMSVAANIAYGLPPGGDGMRAVGRWLEFFHLADKAAARPGELSGGQQQRVALARALAAEPRALLLDEPLSALDPPIREGLQRELAALKTSQSIPVVLVTHDFNEAQRLGDQVIVLVDGKMVEGGDRREIFARPQKSETARFLGIENVLPARRIEAKGKGAVVDAGGFQVRLEGRAPAGLGREAFLCVRAADVRLAVDNKARPNRFSTRVGEINPLGGTNRILLTGEDLGDARLAMLVDDYVLERYGLEQGSAIRIWLPPEKVFLCE